MAAPAASDVRRLTRLLAAAEGQWTDADLTDALSLRPYTDAAGAERFDAYAAAADLLTEEAAGLRRRAFDVSDGDASVKRSQLLTNCLALVAEYRKHQQIAGVIVTRSDVADVYDETYRP